MKVNHQSDSIIHLDGSLGEGGGQILRSALSLSAITGRPFSLTDIRAGRPKPGLMRQHLTCVRAAAQLCEAQLPDTLGVGSGELFFAPQAIDSPGSLDFAIGSAGSVALLLQTVLPILWSADIPTQVRMSGGTHAQHAPSIEYIDEIYLPTLRQMGLRAEVELQRYGFFPAGGGEVELTVEPAQLQGIELTEPTEESLLTAEVINTADIPDTVARKEFDRLGKKLPIESTRVTIVDDVTCSGNVLLARASGIPGTVVCSTGAKNKRAEQVGKEAARWLSRYHNSPAVVDEYLADQLLLPMALATDQSRYIATHLTPHFSTNVAVIQKFLPVEITTNQIDRFAYEVVVDPT